VGHDVAGRLSLAERDRAPVAPGRLEHAERQRIDVRDRQRIGVVRRRCKVGRGLEAPEEVRLLEDDRGCILRCCRHGLDIGGSVPVGNLHDLEPESRRVGLHHLSYLRVRGLGDDDLRPPRRVLGNEAGIRCDGLAVVARRVRDVHARELADRGLVLEDRLQDALAHLRLVGRVRGEELAALQHGVDHGRHVVVVDAGAEERELARRVHVSRSELAEVRRQLLLRERRLQVELSSEPDGGGEVAEELLDGGDADRPQHVRLVGVGERDERVGHCCARTCLYASTSRSESASDESDMRMRMSQPSPYGSRLTVSGASITLAFTSTTSPESGEIRSETALTDSTSPYDVSLVTVAPTSGGSKCTSSPSASAANHVTPSTASSPSIRAQSCSSWYLRSSGYDSTAAIQPSLA